MHDLMHDLAQEVSGVKSMVAKSDEMYFDLRSVHLSLPFDLYSTWEIPNSMLNMKQLGTFLLPAQTKYWCSYSKSIRYEFLTRFRSLRVLDLHNLGLKSLPSSIGKLIHLRYLNLSGTPIENLQDSITDLWNLQTLRLYDCRELKRLPANMRKLTNLRCLDVDGCDELSHMPSGLGGLTSLNSLPKFTVGTAADQSYNSSTAKLSDLKNLNNLRGELHIRIKVLFENSSMLEAREAELSNKHGLTELIISLPYVFYCNYDEAVLEGLRPPSNIMSLQIRFYHGKNLPSWARMDSFCVTLSNLVEIRIDGWKRCKRLPALSQLPFLKYLTLSHIESVEYIESDDVCGVPSSSTFFPSLEKLELYDMPSLKGWWKEEDAIENENETSEIESASTEIAAQRIPRLMQFSKLSVLLLRCCPNLRLLPVCSSSSVPSSSSTGTGLKLKKLEIDNAEDLLSLPNHCLLHLSYLKVDGDKMLESTERLGDVFATLSSSLRSLEFWNCRELRSITKGLEHLTALETLKFMCCANLDEWGDEEEGMPWKAFNTSLRSLTLWDLPKLVGLPRGLQHLSNLLSLSLKYNHQLEELPEWMNCLSSLEYLKVDNCLKVTRFPKTISQLTMLKHLEIITDRSRIQRTMKRRPRW